LINAGGYWLGNKLFPQPATPAERFYGVVPAVVGGAFVIGYINAFLAEANNGQSSVSLVFAAPNPSGFVPVILAIAIIAIVIALIAARTKKSAPKK
jgi:hypothetical protein